MRTKLLVIVVATAVVSGCTTEDYYRSANKSAELNTSANLDKIDTIKTSAVSRQRTFVFPIAAADENGNMNLLATFANVGETRIIGRSDDGDDEAIEAIELTKERYNFTRQVEFIPTSDGRHSIYVRVRDDFGNVTSIEKQVYSFTNMRPKLKVGYYANVHYDAGGGRDGVYHELDFSASYDRDSLYGGDIDSLFVLCEAVDFINAYPDQAIEGIVYNAVKVSDYIPGKGMHIGKYVVRPRDGLPDDGSGATEHFTDIYAWVKDNEGLVSDTVHIPIGHVENSVPRTEYEGR